MNKQRYEINMIKRFFWSSLSLPAYGQVGQGQHSLAAHFALRNTKFGGGKKLETESEGGQKFLPPNPLPFCPPERSVWRAKRAISSVQNRFGFRQTNAPKPDIPIFWKPFRGRHFVPPKHFPPTNPLRSAR